MKKILILITLILTLTLAACHGGPPKIEFECDVNTNACRVRVIFKTLATDFTSIDATLARVNLSQSSVSILTNSGTIGLIIKNASGVIVATNVFSWHRTGDFLYPSNSNIISNWINSNMQAGYEVTSDISGIETSLNPGNNTFTAILEYGRFGIGGSASFYLNNADLNGF